MGEATNSYFKDYRRKEQLKCKALNRSNGISAFLDILKIYVGASDSNSLTHGTTYRCF